METDAYLPFFSVAGLSDNQVEGIGEGGGGKGRGQMVQMTPFFINKLISLVLCANTRLFFIS